MPKPPYKRANKRTQHSTDSNGTVIVSLHLTVNGKYAKGNMTRTVTIHDATVSGVKEVIEKALFGEGG